MADRQTSNLYVPVRFWYLAPCNQADVETREAGQRVNVITASASEKTLGGLQPKAVSGSVKPENKKRCNYGSKEKEEGLLRLWCIGYRPYHKDQGWEGGYGNYLELRW